MIKYLFDTDTTSFLMKKKFPTLQQRFLQEPPDTWAISSVSLGEILFGLEPLSIAHPARWRAANFLQTAHILDWPEAAAGPYARIRHSLRHQPIGDRDLMIAAHAMALSLTLVTNNLKHFSRIGAPLKLENWV